MVPGRLLPRRRLPEKRKILPERKRLLPINPHRKKRTAGRQRAERRMRRAA
jgi:hypothetical protein